MFSAEKQYICSPIFQSLKETMTHVVVQFWCGFKLVNLVRLLNSSNLLSFKLLYFQKTNFDEITHLTGPTKFSSLADSG